MKLTKLLLLTAPGALIATPAFAAEENGGILTPAGGLMFWTLVVFGLVLFVLYKFAYPLILGAVEAREQRIRELLAAAARDREEAQALLEQQRHEHEELRTRAQEIFSESRAAGERLREELLAGARQEREEMLIRARRDIQQEMERAIDSLRGEMVEVAIAAAERLIRKNLDDSDNRRLVRSFLDEVEAPTGTPAGV